MSGEERFSGPVEFMVGPHEAGWRLDVFLAERFPSHSRGLIRKSITHGGAMVDGRGSKPAYRLKPGQRVRFEVPDLPRQAPRPEAIPLDVLYLDDWMAAVNKPSGMVVHPARGHWSGTLASALVHHFGTLSSSGGPTRPGIVHRLDRDTSGVILVARNDLAHSRLAMQFESRTIQKEYFALVSGQPELDRDLVDRPIGVHPFQREKMAIRRDASIARSAQSFYEVLERFEGFAAIRVLPKTGRTHQIRVHLAHLGCPVLCDRQYGGRSQITRGELRRDPADETVLLARQALHARRLRLAHPKTGEPLQIEAPLAPDIAGVLAELREYRPMQGRK